MEMMGYLEADRERFRQSLQEADTLEKAGTAVEGELERLLVQYNENCTDEREREAALLMMQAAKSAAPLISTAGEPRIWELHGGGTDEKGAGTRIKPAVWGFLAAALAAGAVSFLYLMSAAQGNIAPLTLVKALPGLLAGLALAFAAGRSSSGGGRKKSAGVPEGQRRVEMRADPDKIWNCLRAIVLVIDRNLKDVRERAAADQRIRRGAPGSGLSGDEMLLLSDLLELAYSLEADHGSIKEKGAATAALKQTEEEAGEMIGHIRFYLHKKNVDLADYTAENKKEHGDWFERLPAPAGQVFTLRPALVQEGELLRQGMAADGG